MITKNKKIKVIFLDRDGVINHDYGYVGKIENFKFIDGVFYACKYFINLGYKIIIITNQSGIGRGYYSENDFSVLTSWMIKEFNKNDIDILKVYHCPHIPSDNCNCRKPNPLMITQAVEEFDIDLNNSWLIGDNISDINTAINSKIKNYILIDSQKNNQKNYMMANNLIDATNIIID